MERQLVYQIDSAGRVVVDRRKELGQQIENIREYSSNLLEIEETSQHKEALDIDRVRNVSISRKPESRAL